MQGSEEQKARTEEQVDTSSARRVWRPPQSIVIDHRDLYKQDHHTGASTGEREEREIFTSMVSAGTIKDALFVAMFSQRWLRI
jgi:hypothetical protein